MPPPHRAPPVTLLPEARYHEVMSAFGGRGFLVRTPLELRQALSLSLEDWERPSLLNVLIDPASDRKQQVRSDHSQTRGSILLRFCVTYHTASGGTEDKPLVTGFFFSPVCYTFHPAWSSCEGCFITMASGLYRT